MGLLDANGQAEKETPSSGGAARLAKGCGLIVVAVVALSVLALLLPASWTGERFAPIPQPSPPRSLVTSREFGERWPLTVDAGTLRCEKDYGSSVVIVVGSVKYALNGRARGQIDQTGWRDSREIVRRIEGGGLADVGPLIEIGLALCN